MKTLGVAWLLMSTTTPAVAQSTPWTPTAAQVQEVESAVLW
jgi:hypothetical protein